MCSCPRLRSSLRSMFSRSAAAPSGDKLRIATRMRRHADGLGIALAFFTSSKREFRDAIQRWLSAAWTKMEEASVYGRAGLFTNPKAADLRRFYALREGGRSAGGSFPGRNS